MAVDDTRTTSNLAALQSSREKVKAVLCKAFGPPESLILEEVADPIPGPDEVVVDMKASALNFPDVLMIAGKYQSQPPFPFSPGSEMAGVISAVGNRVQSFTAGERVFGGVGHGGFAEKVVINARNLRRMPDDMSFEQASGISTAYGTSYYALKQRANLQPGETLLVLGAAGGVGLAAVELGKAMGARVIAAASTDEKLDIARRSGADERVNYSDGDLKEKVKALTGGQGVDVIYDPVGGDLFDQCMRCIGWYGRVLVIGFAAGDIPKVPINLILLKSCQVVGVFYGRWSASRPDENAANLEEILELYADGKIDPLISSTYSLQHYAQALRCLSERRAIGKVVVTT